MVFEAVNDEIRIMKCFLFGDELNIFCDSGLNSIDLFGLIVSKKLSF
jgi:hypothetical protein